MKHRADGAMERRTFFGASLAAALAARSASAVKDAAPQAREEDRDMPEVSYWMHGFGGDPKTTAAALKEAGFDIVVAGGDVVIAAVNEAGMQAWLCGGAFGYGGLENEDSHKAVDILGETQVWFGSGSPNDPEIRAANLKSYESMVATPGVTGILVDGCRFASPASGLRPFFTDFSEHSERKAAQSGYDFGRMKQDVRVLFDLVAGLGKGCAQGAVWLTSPAGVVEWLTLHPGVLDWLRFRRACVTEHFRDISAIIHGAGLRMGVYIFTPSFAPLVGQAYVDLAEFVDVFAPMIYRNYPDRPGPACLNWELMVIPEELGLTGKPEEATVMELILSWTGLADVVPSRSIEEVRAAVPPEAVGRQTAMARAQLPTDKELAPIIYIDDPDMAKTAALVRDNGADGINFFVFKENWREMTRPAMP
ncbi:MAG: hypothetical protein KA184_19385 [Candidatus Hydrogenedentes bacterium]|nr:hypothetical protein [Candidatus Hydrogenedentota bacterium]